MAQPVSTTSTTQAQESKQQDHTANPTTAKTHEVVPKWLEEWNRVEQGKKDLYKVVTQGTGYGANAYPGIR
ncbi:MAG: hypothetical protein SP1CHLAM54_06320 [Chlamydiia bacterium]|nr:hypothetical protein [Chlamydiia bacterium]MCH9615542.1 hypothetical protein [Chlamydiia bacterium]MCH9629197.1 hypothetical protein [Chlamydiia bacterium]